MAVTPKYRKHSIVFSDPSLTQQQHKDDCDINVIMRRFASGQNPMAGRGGQPVFQDLSGLGSYHEMCNTVAKVQQDFMALPSHLRERFGNDPQQLLDFVGDDANRPEAEELGLVPARPVPPQPEDGSWEAPPQGQPAKPAKGAPKPPKAAPDGEAE